MCNSNSVKYPEGVEIPAQAWVFRHASFILSTRAHEKLQFEHRLGRQTLLTVFLKHSSFLSSGTYMGGTKEPHTGLSGFRRVLKTCLEHIIYAVLKNSRDCNGAQRIQVL